MKKKSNVFQVSQSKINLWRKCRYAYFLRYVRKIRKKFKARPLQFGSLVHGMAEADANADDPVKWLDNEFKEQGKLFASQRDEYEEIVNDARTIMLEYFDYWKQAAPKDVLTYIRRGGKAAEHEFELPLVDGIVITGYLDNLAATGDKRRWLVERKSFSRDMNDDHRWRNLQSSIYKWAADELGIKIDGICWDYIRSKSPTTPQILKDGTISNKRLDTLPSALRAFGKEHGLKVPPRMIKTAEEGRSRWFYRKFTSPKKTTVKMIVADAVETAVEMSEQHGKKKARTIDRHCEWCEFEPICRAELTGADAEFIIKKEYTERAKEDVEIQSE